MEENAQKAAEQDVVEIIKAIFSKLSLRIENLEDRVDKLVDALDKSKSVRGI